MRDRYKWAEKAVTEYKARHNGRLEAKESTKEDLQAVIELCTAEMERMKKKIQKLQKAVEYQMAILEASTKVSWIDRHYESIMEKEL